MIKTPHFLWICIVFIILASCKGPSYQPNTESIPTPTSLDTQAYRLAINNIPIAITRTIIEDKAGQIWFATFDGLYKYDGSSFDNVSRDDIYSRCFSVLEDKSNNLWLGTIGSGAYHYDGRIFKNFTTDHGLIGNEIVCIYEDKKGDLWFGANGGFSIYDGKSFQNFVIQEDSIVKAQPDFTAPPMQRPFTEVNSIIGDANGQYWFGTRGSLFIYNGENFTKVIHNGQPFTNVRWLIEDTKGLIWLGGNDGLYRYDGLTYTQITENFVGYIYEDKNGNIWTSSETSAGWALSRYERKTMDSHELSVTEVKNGEGMFFGITEDAQGNIWVGTLDGVYRYDDTSFEDFKNID